MACYTITILTYCINNVKGYNDRKDFRISEKVTYIIVGDLVNRTISNRQRVSNARWKDILLLLEEPLHLQTRLLFKFRSFNSNVLNIHKQIAQCYIKKLQTSSNLSLKKVNCQLAVQEWSSVKMRLMYVYVNFSFIMHIMRG